MEKRFNDTGVCVPEKHYMVDISNKIAQIVKIIEKGDYFVINRPRQYGKTTTIYMVSRYLKASIDIHNRIYRELVHNNLSSIPG